MRARSWDIVAVTSLALSALGSALVYERLPARVATHFDLAGNANGWMDRGTAAAFLPLFGLAIWGFVRLAPRILPGGDRKRLPPAQIALVSSLTAIFLAALQGLILYVAIVPGASLLSATWLLVGAFFVALGLVMPRVRRNPLVGVRTAWALRSDENWARTQRVGGATMVVGGIVCAIAGVVGGPFGGIVAMVALFAAAALPAVYSLVLARRHDVG